MKQKNSRLVYSTEGGRSEKPNKKPISKKTGDGIVRVRREVKGRGGKTVTTIHDVPLFGAALRDLAGELRRACGTGGTLKDGIILLQGDYCDKAVQLLTSKGFTAKRAGG